MKRKSLAALLLFTCALVGEVAPARAAEAASIAERWDLARTLSFALESAPDRLAADESRAASEDSERAARAGLFPKLAANSTHGFVGSDPGGSSTEPWSSSTSIELSVPLYDNGTSWRSLRTSRVASEVASIQATEKIQNLGLEVIRAYYSLSYSGYSLEAVKSRRDTLAKQYRLADSLYRQGLRTKVDVRRFEIQDQRAALELREAEAELRRSSARLKALLGFKEDAGLTFVPVSLEADKLSAPSKDLEALRAEDIRARRVAALQIETARESYEAARRTTWPELSLKGGASYGWANYIGAETASDPTFSWNALASLDFVIFDGGARSSSASRELHDLRSSEIALQKLDAELKASLQNLDIDLKLLRGNLEANRKLRVLEEENYAALEARYRDGKTNYLDLIDGLRSLLSARLGEYQGTRDYRLKEAERMYYQGRIHEFN